ncbi:unnamed protein product [Cladocopium goreaui]|uniref:Uncharacterized protein MT1414 n=1 Tax=Cladocopium goreaui TaxID=2562237 RepID=A0A9P1CC81_9DINO|nr:unnamed protein product [Cladocopium goreaui]
MVGTLKRPASSSRSSSLCGFPRSTPEAEGLAAAPLEELRRSVAAEVKCGALADAAHVVLRHGKCVVAFGDGKGSKESNFTLRSLCKLHGCTKPLVACAFLTLVDSGKVKLSDPVSKYIPFSEVKATKAKKPKAVETVPTLRNLLTMTAGLQYQDCPAYRGAMKQIRQGKIRTLAAMCEALAEQPLQNEPGSCYTYSFCTDFLGRVCEKVSGKSLEAFMKKALLDPLGMRDTHFVVPAKKRSRQATLYDCQRVAGNYVCKVWQHAERADGIMSGGGGILSYHDPGMWSTVEDYVKFCQMLLTGRSATGKQILRPKTLQSLWQDSLVEYGRKDGRLPGWHDASGRSPGGVWDYTGWSLLNTHLTFEEPPKAGVIREGQTMWMGGGGGTYWVVDRVHSTVAVSFSQSFGGRGHSTDAAKDASVFTEAAVEEGEGQQPGQPPKRRRMK